MNRLISWTGMKVLGIGDFSMTTHDWLMKERACEVFGYGLGHRADAPPRR